MDPNVSYAAIIQSEPLASLLFEMPESQSRHTDTPTHTATSLIDRPTHTLTHSPTSLHSLHSLHLTSLPYFTYFTHIRLGLFCVLLTIIPEQIFGGVNGGDVLSAENMGVFLQGLEDFPPSEKAAAVS